jgi:cytoplasmic iron level regulating protein YaaA (DUF328/UPF0246 family)
MRAQVAGLLTELGGGDGTLLGVGGAHLERAQAANLALIDAPTLPAWQRFTGVVWDHFDVANLPAAARQRASERVVVVSALAGLSALDDPLPDHRLKMSARLNGTGKLATWWKPRLSEVLNTATRGSLVVNLLPGEHAAAWDSDPHNHDVVNVDLVDDAGRRAGHAAKAAKGLLAAELAGAESRRAVERLLDGSHSVGGFRVQPRS